jgi:hypothetical protein
MHMAHPPHASAAIKPGTDRFLDSSALESGLDASEAELAHRALRADGLNAVERSEREAALDENRSEEAEIFERAASRLRPAWSGPDEMLELGLANALPDVIEPAPANDDGPRHPFEPVVLAPSSFPAIQLPFDDDSAVSTERTDRFPALTDLKQRARSFVQQRRIAVVGAAVGCVLLGGLWAALSGDEAAKPAPAPVAPLQVAPVAAPVPVAPVVPRVVTRVVTSEIEQAPTPAPVKTAVARPQPKAKLATAKKPLAKKPLAKAPLKLAPAKKPLANQKRVAR